MNKSKKMKEGRSNIDSESKEDIIKNKLNKENLKALDIKKILDYSNDKSDGEDTYKNRMKRFREIYGYNEGLNEFKKGKRYRFEKEWHGLFLVLLSTLEYNPKFNRDEIKQMHTIGTIHDYNEVLMEAIDKYLPEKQKEDIKKHPLYRITKAEEKMLQKIEDNLTFLFRNIAIMPALKRLQSLVDINDTLQKVLMETGVNYDRHILEMNAEIDLGNNRDNLNRFEETLSNLEELINHRLKTMHHNKGEKVYDDVEFVSKDLLKDNETKEIFSQVITDKMMTGDLEVTIPKNNPAAAQKMKMSQEIMTKEIENILNEPSNKEILKKVSSVLNEDKANEKELKVGIERMLLYMSITTKDKIEKSRRVKRILNMTLYNNTLERAMRDD